MNKELQFQMEFGLHDFLDDLFGFGLLLPTIDGFDHPIRKQHFVHVTRPSPSRMMSWTPYC